MPRVEKRFSNSDLLRTKISLFSSGLDEAAHRFWTHAEFPAAYRAYLYYSHSIIRATVPLMRAALAAFRSPKFASDPVMFPVADYLERHIQEESGHDEWILDDAEAMGLPRASLIECLPSQTASHIVGAQYYWIHHFHPIAILGYIAVMEGNPSSSQFFKNVARRNKLPLQTISSFLYHTRIDPTHRDDLNRLLDGLPLKQRHVELIGLSAIRTIHYMTDVLNEISESYRELVP